ncbi:MAG: GNAT family N-acetyltransferase [Chloroflexia bacterium]|nr:GNAT family N-acetyltransferase [Chloroflexia bacterium]
MPFGLGQTRQGPLSIQSTREEDRPALRAILKQSSRAYTGLGGGLRQTIQDDLSLTAWQDNLPAGFIIAHRQGPSVFWIHAFALDRDVAPSQVGSALLERLDRSVAQQGAHWIAYMDEYPQAWLQRLLEKRDFQRHTRVLAYETTLHRPPQPGNQKVQVRPARPEDIPNIAQIDQQAFAPLWAYRQCVLDKLIDQVSCFLIAESAAGLCGYILCTEHRGPHAHVVRLAVAPSWQGQGVGTRLLGESFSFFQSRGVRSISLNTQKENWESQRLYQRFGFRPTGDSVQVWAKVVTVAAER